MPISLQYGSARAFMALPACPGAVRSWSTHPDVVFCLQRDEEMAVAFGREERSFPPASLAATVRAVLAGTPPPGDSGYFRSYHEKLTRVRAHPGRYEQVLQLLDQLDPARLAAWVLEYLPAGATLDTTIYVVPNNHTNAYFHQGCVVVSFAHLDTAWGQILMRAQEGQEGWPLIPVLAHELHHVGQATLPRPDLDPQLACAHELLGGVAGEGTATRFFTLLPGDPRWEKAQAQVPGYLARLEELLRQVLDGSLGPAEARTRFLQVLHEPDGDGPGPVYVLGVHLVQAVYDHGGVEGVRDLLARPLSALQVYNQAPGAVFAFDRALAQRLAGG